MLSPEKVLDKTIENGIKKVNRSFQEKMILGFLGGALISLGALAFLRAIELFQGELAGFGPLIGGLLFPVGLIIILIGGGELATGNMMVVGTSLFAKHITILDYAKNIGTILFWNFIGALFVALCLGKIAGTFDPSVAISVAEGKLNGSYISMFFSAIGCNWLVGAAVWMSTGAKDAAGKAIVIYIPIAIFVILGFQHSVANFFFLSASAFSNGTTWFDLIYNAVPVILGNIVGGLLFVAAAYYYGLNSKKFK